MGNPEAVDIYRRFLPFYGGQQPHETEPFQGERYSAVFYTSNMQPKNIPARQNRNVQSPSLDVNATIGSTSTSGSATNSTAAGSSRSSTSTTGTNSFGRHGRSGKSNATEDVQDGSVEMKKKFLAMKKKIMRKLNQP